MYWLIVLSLQVYKLQFVAYQFISLSANSCYNLFMPIANNMNSPTNVNFFFIVCFILLHILIDSATSDALVSQSFFTNQFTDNDFGAWTIMAVSLPPNHLFSQCGPNRVFGGYEIFGGDPTQPTKLQRVFTGLIAHYSVNIKAKIYKIDSWNNQQLFVMVDSQTQAKYQWNSTTGSNQICGDPNPVINGINSNYNDSIVTLNINVTHSSSTLNLTFATSLKSLFGWWAVRQIQVELNLCDKSCKSCTSPALCTSCQSTIPGLVLVGAYCSCTTAGTINEQDSFCTAMPCINCVGTCSPGYYFSAQCLPCNIACATCAGPANNAAQCTTCALGYFRFNPATDPCYDCFSACSACTDLTSTGCTNCAYGYFFLNNECLSQCPPGFYSQQSTASCSPCINPCATCDGATNQHCLSCAINYYLLSSQCYLTCPSPYFGYNGVCYEECPIATFTDNTFMSCNPCSANCDQCSTATSCTTCTTGFFLHNSACQNPCPAFYYQDATSSQCVGCDASCSTCNGPSQTNCLLCSNPSYFLVDGSCLVSCPNSTYSALCLPCDSSCLKCSGGANNQCTSCSQPNYLNLNTSICVGLCPKGSIIDKVNYQQIFIKFRCWNCDFGYVSYFQKCVKCNPACETCYGINFLQCSSCRGDSSLVRHTCELINQRGVIPSRLSSLNLQQAIYIFTGITIGIGMILQFILTYKSPLLPLIQLLQILAYQYYLSIQMSETVQSILLTFYYTHFSSVISLETQVVQNFPDKLIMMNKTGYYVLDTLSIHLILLFAAILFLLLKKIHKLNDLFNAAYAKLNPYLITYLYRLMILQQSLALIVFLSYGNISTTYGIISMIFVFVDILIIGFALFWKIKTEHDSKQYALFYFNEIGQHEEDYQVYKKSLKSQKKSKLKIINLAQKITSGSILPSLLFYLGKMPFAFIVVLLIEQPKMQVICFFSYSLFFGVVSFLAPYRRRIYKFLHMMLCLCVVGSSGLLLGSQSAPQLSIYVEVICLFFIIGILLVSIFQIFVNFRFWINYLRRAKIAIIQFFTKTEAEKQTTQSSSQNQSQNSHKASQRKQQVPQNQFKNNNQPIQTHFHEQEIQVLQIQGDQNKDLSIDLADRLNQIKQNQPQNSYNEFPSYTGTNELNSNQSKTSQKVENLHKLQGQQKMVEKSQKFQSQIPRQKKARVSLDFDL